MKTLFIALSGLFLITATSCTKTNDLNSNASKRQNQSTITNVAPNGGGTADSKGNGTAGKF